MFIYLCHDLWEVVVAAFLIYPFFKDSKEIDFIFFGISFIVIITLTELLSFTNYYVFNFLYNMLTKKKDKLKFEM